MFSNMANNLVDSNLVSKITLFNKPRCTRNIDLLKHLNNTGHDRFLPRTSRLDNEISKHYNIV